MVRAFHHNFEAREWVRCQLFHRRLQRKRGGRRQRPRLPSKIRLVTPISAGVGGERWRFALALVLACKDDEVCFKQRINVIRGDGWRVYLDEQDAVFIPPERELAARVASRPEAVELAQVLGYVAARRVKRRIGYCRHRDLFSGAG